MAQGRTSLGGDFAVATVQWAKTSDPLLIMSTDFKKLIETAQSQLQRALTLDEKKKLLNNSINEAIITQAANESPNKLTSQQINNQMQQQVKAAIERELAGRPINRNEMDERIQKEVQQQTALLLRQSGLRSVEDLAKSMTMQNYLRSHPLYPKEEPSFNVDDSEISKFYEENKSRFIRPETIRISHIFFLGGSTASSRPAAKKRADDVLSLIRSNKSYFEAQVLDESDDSTTRVTHGDLGFTTLERAEGTFMGKETVRQLFQLKVGEVSKVYETQQGYHIFKITDKRDLLPLTLNDRPDPLNVKTVRQQIKELLEMQQKASTLESILEKIASQLRTQNPGAVQVRVTDDTLRSQF